jgi:hypothetical protein
MVTKNIIAKVYFANVWRSPPERWHRRGGQGKAFEKIREKSIEGKCKDFTQDPQRR